MRNKLILIVFLICVSVNENFASKCAKKITAHGLACVCNATYCDSIEPIGQIPEGKYVEYTTTKNEKRLEKTVRSFWSVTNENAIKMMVDPENTFQTMFGFGGSVPDATLINIHRFPEYMQKKIVSAIFAVEGLECEILRIPIGGTDMSDRPYSLDDGPPDPELKNFNLTKEDYLLRIPFLEEAKKFQSKLKLSACPWSPPAWMKTNNRLCGGRLLPRYYQAFADYLIKYLDFYHHHGIDMWAVSPINEPLSAGLPLSNLNSILISYEVMGEFISKHLGPTLRRSERSNVKLLALEDLRPYLTWWIDEMMKNNTARDYIDGFALHSYQDRVALAEIQTVLKEKYPEKFLISTEIGALPSDMWGSKNVKIGDWEPAATFALRSLENLNYWVTGTLDWNLVGNLQGGPAWNGNSVNAPITANPDQNEFYKQPLFYVIGHFSKFVREGDVKIYHSMPKVEKLHVSCFKRGEDNRVSIIFYNEHYEKRFISIQRDQDNLYLNIILDPFSIKTIVYYP